MRVFWNFKRVVRRWGVFSRLGEFVYRGFFDVILESDFFFIFLLVVEGEGRGEWDLEIFVYS